MYAHSYVHVHALLDYGWAGTWGQNVLSFWSLLSISGQNTKLLPKGDKISLNTNSPYPRFVGCMLVSNSIPTLEWKHIQWGYFLSLPLEGAIFYISCCMFSMLNEGFYMDKTSIGNTFVSGAGENAKVSVRLAGNILYLKVQYFGVQLV